MEQVQRLRTPFRVQSSGWVRYSGSRYRTGYSQLGGRPIDIAAPIGEKLDSLSPLIETTMSAENCERALRTTAAELDSLLGPLGFRFHFEHAGKAHQPFASGFFVREDIKVGLIYRVSHKFGAVIYANNETNVSHDDLMSWLGLATTQRLRYVESAMQSVAADCGNATDALRADLETLRPILRDEKTLRRAIGEARRHADQRERDAAAAKAAKLEAWLQRRRGK